MYSISPEPSSHELEVTTPEAERTEGEMEEKEEQIKPARIVTGSGGVASRKFAVRSVGNRYNFSNYWSGRWRSSWDIDLDSGEMVGQFRVNVHYYEQGNVQLSTSHSVTIPLPSSSSSPAEPAFAKALLRVVQSAEESYQLSLNTAYVDLAEKTFRGLRRALPMTRQKVDWLKIASYRLGGELGGSKKE